MREPEPNEVISNGVLKNFTGHDPIMTRDLFSPSSKMIQFVPYAQLHLLCNATPQIQKNEDQAVWNRIKIIDFESTFVDPNKAPTTWEEQLKKRIFPKNKEFNKEMKKYESAFCYYLIQNWKKIKDNLNDSNPPDCVVASTENYKHSNDVINMFVKEETEDDPSSLISLNTFITKLGFFIQEKQHELNIVFKKQNTQNIISHLRTLGISVSEDGFIEKKKLCRQ
jgi:phage/plasmid-associated DNA primase